MAGHLRAQAGDDNRTGSRFVLPPIFGHPMMSHRPRCMDSGTNFRHPFDYRLFSFKTDCAIISSFARFHVTVRFV